MRLALAGALLSAVVSGAPAGNSSEYEYVVVGSGPGGGTLA